MFSQYACINGCNVCIYIFMDVMFKCRYIYACICMFLCMYVCHSKFDYCLHNIFFIISLKYLIFHGLM